MLGKGGLRERDLRLKLGDGGFAFVQAAKNHKSVCVGQAFEKLSRLIGLETESGGFHIHAF